MVGSGKMHSHGAVRIRAGIPLGPGLGFLANRLRREEVVQAGKPCLDYCLVKAELMDPNSLRRVTNPPYDTLE
jgi:hypothetical protein